MPPWLSTLVHAIKHVGDPDVAHNPSVIIATACARIFVLVGLACVIVPKIRVGLTRVMPRRRQAWHLALVLKALTSLIWMGVFFQVLNELGFAPSFVFGALPWVAIFAALASQALMYDYLCGLLFRIEEPFKQGDTITVNGVSGEVLQIKLMSITLKISDDQSVRIPHRLTQSSLVTIATG